ncbi:MAG TPA: flagellar basal-body MS-ring/collar protein FliF [Spirochaetota bacterium]|nr:flagellar basal-body MS-ring/collar protein FliF [Spirochaetota bacterium]
MEKLKEIFQKFAGVLKKLSTVQKIIISAVAVILLAAVIVTLSFSGKAPGTPLFQSPISEDEYKEVTKELDIMGVPYSRGDKRKIYLTDPDDRERVVMRLSQKGVIPDNIKGWELFDMESWTTTKFDRDVKLRRAIEGELKRHIESLSWIEFAKISMSKPEDTIYTDKKRDVAVSVSLRPSPGHFADLENKDYIKGIQNIILHGVDGVIAENITITDDRGEKLNDFSAEDDELHYKNAKTERRIIDEEREKIQQRIENAFKGVLPRDRYQVDVDLKLSFHRVSYEKKDLLPMVVKEDNPDTPYDDSEVIKEMPISKKNVEEKFKGQSFVPEGPPGQEPNLPPGYKEHIDRWNVYNKDEDIVNYEYGEKRSKYKKMHHDIEYVSVAVDIDGVWEKQRDAEGEYLFVSNQFVREYQPVPDVRLKKFSELVKASISYNTKRGDSVVVRNIQFDRRDQFRREDEQHLKELRTKRFLLIILFSILAIFIITIAYKLVKKEMLRRKRMRERELARQRQQQRDEALRALEAEAPAETMSEADRHRQELQEKAEQLAQERPAEVAKLLKTWIQEDS